VFTRELALGSHRRPRLSPPNRSVIKISISNVSRYAQSGFPIYIVSLSVTIFITNF